MSETDNDKGVDRIRFARQELDKERAHRREKVWKIFSWAATLLIAITGGVIALKTNPPQGFTFPWWLRGVFSGSALVLMGFAGLWIEQNLKILTRADEAIAECDGQLGIKKVIPEGRPILGYNYALRLLAMAAIIAIVIEIS